MSITADNVSVNPTLVTRYLGKKLTLVVTWHL